MSRCVFALALVLTLLTLTTSSRAAEVRVHACPTILNSLAADYAATLNSYRRPDLIPKEMNPVVRQIGPDLYFAAWITGVMATCRENSTWRVASVVVWVIQTWAVGRHRPVGTAEIMPLLTFSVSW